MFPCLRGYNSGKNGTTIKSKVSFKIYMQFSFWWAPKFLHLDHWNLKKWSSKKATLHLKSWQNPTHFQLLLYSSLSAINYFHFFQMLFVGWAFRCPDYKIILGNVLARYRGIHHSIQPKNLDQKKAPLVIFLKVGLPSLNLIFSGSNGPNVKISVPIRKRIACRF